MVPALQLHNPPSWEWPSKPRCLHETYGGRIAAHGSVQLKTCEPPVNLTMFSAWAGLASQSLTFISRALGRPEPPKLSLSSAGLSAGPTPHASPHFYRRSPGPVQPPSPHFYRQNSSLLSTEPGRPGSESLTSNGQPLISIGDARPRQSRKL